MKPYRHQILENIVDGELKLALVEIIDEILAQDTACTKMNQGEKKLVTSDNQVVANETGCDAHGMTHRNISDDIFQFDKNNLRATIPAIDMYGQLLWPAAKRRPSGNATHTNEYLDSDEIKRNEQLNISTEAHHSKITAENSEATPDQPTNSSQQLTYTAISLEQKTINSGQTIPNKLDDEVASLGDNINNQNTQAFLRPNQERKLILILIKMFNAEFRKGNYPFDQVARSVLQLLGEKFGSNVVNQISIEHLQGAYIGISARFKNQGATQACDVIAIKNKNELGDTIGTSENGSTNLKNDTQDAKVVYLMGEGIVQHQHHGSNEIGKRRIRNSIGVAEKNDPQVNTGTPNISSGTTDNNVYPLSGSTCISEVLIESGSAALTEFLVEHEVTANIMHRNSPEADSVAQYQKFTSVEALPVLIKEKQAEGFRQEKYFANALNSGTEINEHLDAVHYQSTKHIDAIMAMEGSFSITDNVHTTLNQSVDTPAPPVENTTQNELHLTTVAQNQALDQLLSTNTLIPLDKACAARTRIKSKLESHAAKPNPELLIDGATLAVAFIEAGIREYSEYTQLMINDFGCTIEPSLRDFYEGACYYLGLDCPKEYQTHQVRGGIR